MRGPGIDKKIHIPQCKEPPAGIGTIEKMTGKPKGIIDDAG
jgi:hypothetical protein